MAGKHRGGGCGGANTLAIHLNFIPNYNLTRLKKNKSAFWLVLGLFF